MIYQKIIILVLFFICGPYVMAESVSSVDDVKRCDTFLTQMSENYDDLSVEERINAFTKQYEKCSNDKEYVINYTLQLSLHDEFDKAIKVLDAFKSAHSNFKSDKEILFAEIDIKYAEIVRRNNSFIGALSPTAIKDLKVIEKKVIKFSRNYPEWFVPYERLSDINLVLGNYESSIDYAEKSNNLKKTYPAYRNIILASSNLHRDHDVIETMRSIYPLFPEELEDKDIAIAISMAYTNLHKFLLARNALLYLLQMKPEYEHDAEIYDAVEYIKTAYQRSLKAE